MTCEYETFRRNLDLLVSHEGNVEKLAVRASVSVHTILNWRQRGTRPTLPNITKLAEAFGLKRDDLLDRRLSGSDLGE